MMRAALTLACFVLSLAAPGSGQQPKARSQAEFNALQQRAEQGDAQAQYELGAAYENGFFGATRDYAEALRWYRRAAAQGNVSARFGLAKMFMDGSGVKRDYEEAAYWYRCPKPSPEILGQCKQISYRELPEGATALLRKLNCHVGPGDNYDYGSAVDLNGDGRPEYQFCCQPAPHGPCSSVLVGRIGSQWKNLGASTGGLFGYAGACGLFIVLANRTGGFHDICLPNVCSTFSATACVPTIWQFTDGGYRSIDTSVRPPK